MKFLYTCMIVLSVVYSFAQNSDCATAIPVCNETYVEDNSPTGTGQVFELAPGSCQTAGEFNSAWYVFTVQEAGVLNFILEPNDNDDDYDWSLYDITENGCAGINNGNSPEVSCNSYGVIGGNQGPTGISSAEGGSGTSNGPGDLNGPPFNADLNVQVGDVYVLSVMNYSSTLNGYTLDFSPSTAAIFDDDNPEVVSVTQNCDADELTVTFSENVVTTDLDLDLFALNFNGTIITPAQASAGGGDFSTTVALTFTNPLVGGDYVLQGGDDGSVEDFCGNPWVINEPITISPQFEFGSPVINEACNGTNGSISFPDAEGGLLPFEYTANNNAADDLNFDNINAGNWVLEVTDASQCVYETTVVLPDVIVTVEAGEEQSLCELETTLGAIFTADSFEWQPETGISYADDQNPTTTIEANGSGQYSLVAVATTGDCEATDAVSIVLITPPNITITHTDETCYGYCDGTVAIDNANPGTITAILQGVSSTDNDIQFDELCAGDQELLVIFSDDCQTTYEISIGSPDPVIASFEADPWITTVVNTEVLFTNTSENADSVFWQLSGYPEENSTEDSWSVVLPELLGSYQMVITAYGENGCTDQFIGYVLIQDEFQFYIPNAFTPDGDNINEVFLPQFSYPPNDYELMIFDRWGEVIFRTTDYWQPWTGEVHGGEYYAANGIYNWVMKTRGAEVEVQTYTGHVNLVR